MSKNLRTTDKKFIDQTSRISFKFEGKNLGNRPEYYYWNTSDRLSQYDEYGYTLSFGVRYSY